jgi:hypothetical protein
MTHSTLNAPEATMLMVRPPVGVIWCRIPPGRRPWQQRGRRHRAGPGAADHHRSTAAVHFLRLGPRPGLGLIPGNGSGPAKLGWQGTEALWEKCKAAI